MNYLLKPVFKSIFDREFQYEKFEDRLKMQKVIYLLQNMGISVGDYNFMWYKHGPYSQDLQNDILNLKRTEDVKVKFSSDAEKEIKALKEVILNNGSSYDQSQWVECLGSLQYIKENLLPSSVGDKDIIKELENRKPHLNEESGNQIALQALKGLTIK